MCHSWSCNGTPACKFLFTHQQLLHPLSILVRCRTNASSVSFLRHQAICILQTLLKHQMWEDILERTLKRSPKNFRIRLITAYIPCGQYCWVGFWIYTARSWSIQITVTQICKNMHSSAIQFFALWLLKANNSPFKWCLVTQTLCKKLHSGAIQVFASNAVQCAQIQVCYPLGWNLLKCKMEFIQYA